jgi:hypothetical protein
MRAPDLCHELYLEYAMHKDLLTLYIFTYLAFKNLNLLSNGLHSAVDGYETRYAEEKLILDHIQNSSVQFTSPQSISPTLTRIYDYFSKRLFMEESGSGRNTSDLY